MAWYDDPDCPPLPDPPAVPKTADLTCHNFHQGQWARRVMYLNPGHIPRWASMALAVDLNAKGQRVNDIWLRFYRTERSNPGQVIGNPYEFYVTSLAQGAKMTIDGIRDKVTISKGGEEVSGSHLVYRSNKGHVLRWPEIDCGGVWQLWVSIPQAIPSSALIVDAQAALKFV